MTDLIPRVDSRRAPELVGVWQQTFRQAYSDVHGPENIEQHCAQSFYDKVGFHKVGSGTILEFGTERLTSTIMAREV